MSKPLLQVIRGKDAEGSVDDFGKIYEQMDDAVNKFFGENKDRIDVDYQKCSIASDIKISKNAFAVVVLGDNAISLFKDFNIPHIPIITSISGYRHKLCQRETFHLWPFVLPSLSYLAVELIHSGDLFEGELAIYIVTDNRKRQGALLSGIFCSAFSYLGEKVEYIDEADDKRIDGLINTKEKSIVYVSGIGGTHEAVLDQMLMRANPNLYIVTDQSISDPGREVPESALVKYFSFLPAHDDRVNEDKFYFFVNETLNLVWKQYESFLKAHGQGDVFSDCLRNTKTYKSADGKKNLFISDVGQLYAPLCMIGCDKVTSIVSNNYNGASQLDIAYLLQVIDEQLQKVLLRYSNIHDIFLPRVQFLTTKLRDIFPAVSIIWHGKCLGSVKESSLNEISAINDSEWSRFVEFVTDGQSFSSPIQIALGAERVFPDNDAFRIYFIEVRNEEEILLPISLLWRKYGRSNYYPPRIIISKGDVDAFDADVQPSFAISDKEKIRVIIDVCATIYREKWNDGKAELFLYLIPEVFVGGQISNGGKNTNLLLMITSKRLTYLDLRVLTNLVTRIADTVRTVISTQKIELESVRSAIGSIMSRNGSHNIGSHVLAALSHNVGTMPDDRVLYQYIQHRMDYIATATTDFPIWSQPLSLVGNVIKNFLIQRHLLDHITGSEGLHAYQFQNDKVPTSAKENSDSKTVCQPKTIRIHARRIKDDMNWNELTHFKVEEKDFIDFIPYPTGDYEDESCKESLLSNDVEVAIPGGVVGRHAFYTIVENVLRNAAKHEWSKLEDENRKSAEAAQEAAKAAQDRAESVQEAVETAQAGAESAAAAVATETVQAQSCLELFVDFKDNPSKGIVEIVIWTDSEYSMQHYAMEQFKNPNGLDRARIEKRLATETGSGTLNLDGLEEHQRLQVKMARSFIAEDGQLRKENWGLAEMRISAGYLNVADIADIGGISTSDLRFELIKPVMIQNGEHYCLGYHFDIPKPKELLIVVPESAGVDEKTMRDAHAMLMQYGVGVMSENDVFEESCKKENSAKLSYAYILLKDFKKKDGAISDVVDKDDMRTWKLPFRVVTESKTELNPEDNKSVDRRADYVFSDNKNVFDSTSQKLYALTTSKEEAKSFATAVLSDVYRSWVQHLKREHYNDNPDAEIILAIDVNREAVNDQGGKKGGKDLVSDADLLKVLFEICFDKAVDSFIQIWETNGNKPCQDKENGDKYCQSEDIDVRLKVTLEQMKKMCPRDVAIEPSRVIKPESDTDGGEKEITIVFTTRQLLRQQLIKWCACIDSDNVPNDVLDSVRDVWEDLCDENENLKNKSDIVGLDAFLDYLEYSVLPQTKVFLSMYEECFVTLPKSITVAKEISEGTTIAALDNQKIEAAITEDEKKELLKYDERLIAYWRHENFETERDCRYLEPLSGAQSYLAAFECLKEESIERTRFVTKLIENGLVRILIIDERAKKFSDEHSEVKKVFDHIGIAVLDDKCPQVESIFSGEGNLDDVVGGEKVCAYDVLVIHQGIIDKKLKDHGNADKIRKFIEGLKRKIRYVVVTTGRGSPANIPPEVRVLPFSVIESTLFRKYPEKMILVDAIMNTLPLARKERS